MDENLQQALIVLFSGVSVWFLAGIKNKRLGFIFALIGQPIWTYATFQAEQWGMFAVSIWFTGNYMRGLWNHRNDKTGDKNVASNV